MILTNQPPKIYGDGEQVRDFTFVENAVQANIKGMLTEKEKTKNKKCDKVHQKSRGKEMENTRANRKIRQHQQRQQHQQQ